ncbi:MAG: hypothetical protein Q7R75_02795 [bacterium]|nr:hypothetical protein [bacterium]
MTTKTDEFIEEEKLKFINNEVLTSSILGGLARGYPVYKQNTKEDIRKEFRNLLRDKLEKYAHFYKTQVGSTQHIKNIKNFADEISAEKIGILKKSRFRIGRVQKLLNLYLKYLWVLNWIPKPPHCPFDSRVIEKLGLNKEIQWTKLDSEEGYDKLVKSANEKAKNKSLSVAEWELQFWNQNNKNPKKVKNTNTNLKFTYLK